MKGRLHSTGAVFVVVNNLPRGIRFLAGDTFLVLLLPGPFEPSKEELNECLEPVIENITKLYEGKFCLSSLELYLIDAGEMMRVYGHPEKEQINATLLMVAADGPARLKFSGLFQPIRRRTCVPYTTSPFPLLLIQIAITLQVSFIFSKSHLPLNIFGILLSRRAQTTPV
jgi:hypothetical protein